MISGVISRAPATAADTVDVVIAAFDDEQTFTGLRWMPRGTDLPAVGADCLVHDPSGADPWVVAWWPAT